MGTLEQDLGYGFRVLRKNPSFAAVAVLTLALGVGANTAIFSVVSGVLLRPLPYPHPEQLVRVTADLSKLNIRDFGMSPPELFDYRDRSGIFAQISGIWPINANLTEVNRPERVETLLVDFNYFELLGARAQLGRLFGSADYQPGNAPIAVISDGLWRRRFGGDASVIGKKFRLDNDLYTVIGVTPANFRHPGRRLQNEVEIWAPTGWLGPPFSQHPARNVRFLPGAIGRLKPGITVLEAQARLDVLGTAIVREFSNNYPANAGWNPRVIALRDDLLGNARSTYSILFLAVGLVLLIACTNVASLLLVKASSRQREIAMRRALGANRGRLVRQLLTESVLLAVLSGIAGLPLAAWGVKLLVAFSPANLTRLGNVSIDFRVLGFALGLSLLTGIAFGLAPAWQASSADLQGTLKETGRGTMGGRRAIRVRNLLIVAEVGLALVLVASATLLVRSFWLLQNVDPGFSPHNLLTAQIWLPQPNNPEAGPYFQHARRVAFFREVLRRVTALPGVRSAAIVNYPPFRGPYGDVRFSLEGETADSVEVHTAQSALVSPGYFETMGIPLLRGRDFTDAEDEKSPLSVIVNQSFVKKYFPDQNPLRQRIRPGNPRTPGLAQTIVGVVGDVHNEGLEIETKPQLYLSYLQNSALDTTLMVRGAADPGGLAETIRREVSAVDPNEPVFAVRTMDQVMAAAVAQRRFTMLLLALFAGAAILLATIGIYGVMSYIVEQRTQELGIRMALGAQRGDVLRLVVGQGMRLALAGVALGLGAALAFTRLISQLLFGVKPTDPATLASVVILISAVALGATYVPARRATRVDPMVALRYE